MNRCLTVDLCGDGGWCLLLHHFGDIPVSSNLISQIRDSVQVQNMHYLVFNFFPIDFYIFLPSTSTFFSKFDTFFISYSNNKIREVTVNLESENLRLSPG